ncbi:hypothetical protein DFH07DRAFT_1029132 [Mycena maculata]|uniref:Uncharacterized protein n=1 Tax=Mycena maculata TaxID=230809 RepID=A0AAD7ND29_9AGAR|nr:hypothetical protein DFH07DRAFT_1029132 [Mycena maculata]
MPPKRADIWGSFHQSDEKPNGHHYRATHWRCIDAERPSTVAIDIELENNWELMKNEEWFEAALASALSKKKDVNGEKGAMAAHLRRCELATAEEKALATRTAPTKREREEAEKREKAKRKQADDGEGDVEADDEGIGGSIRKFALARSGLMRPDDLHQTHHLS